MAATLTFDIHHNAVQSQFECSVDQHLCVADYRPQGDVLLMTHTGVPPSLRGRGIAAALVKGAVDFADAKGLRIHPLCSYVEAYLRCHPETAAVRA